MSKSISKNTMGLRFMQKAMRAKQEAEVEIEQKKVKDDAEWEVSQDVRDAWGLGSSSAAQSSSVTHESSYLPFLFDSTAESARGTKPRGRRTFNARGQEVSAESQANEPAALEPSAPADESSRDHDVTESPRRRTTISGFRVPPPSKKDARQGKTKTAQELIREDVRRRPLDASAAPQPSSQPQAGFMKPAGVEMPAPARAPLKRERDAAGREAHGAEGKKRKKQHGQKDTVVALVE